MGRFPLGMAVLDLLADSQTDTGLACQTIFRGAARGEMAGMFARMCV
jgi:hypothetical protein